VTPPGGPNPVITFFGIANYDGCLACDVTNCACSGTPSPTPEYEGDCSQGSCIQVFTKTSGQIAIVIEARKGQGGFAVDTSSNLHPANLSTRPDLQIESTMAMGNGDPAVDCDVTSSQADWMGIAAVPTPSFGPDASITSALRDFACRFSALSPSLPYTLDSNGAEALANAGAHPTVQFIDLVAFNARFQPGRSLLTLQLQDEPPFGSATPPHVSFTAQIILRVVTPTPAPTP